MNHAEHLVDLVDEKGVVVGTKKRQDINKKTDLYHTVFVLLRTPDSKLVLTKIPHREDLPNLYAGLLGPTVSTIRRHEEKPDEAARRVVKNELYLDNVQVAHVGTTYLVLPDQHRKYMSVFVASHTIPDDFSHQDIQSLHTFTQTDIEEALTIDSGQFALTFLAIWEQYKESLLSA